MEAVTALVQQGAKVAKSGIGETPLQLSVRLGHQQMQQVLRELARIKRIMRDAAAREHRAGEIAGGGAVEEECEPSTSQRSSYPSAPPSVEAAVQAPSANAFAALVAFSLLAASAALCIAGMLVFYIARWVSETSVWLAALAATTFSGFANTAAAFCIAGLLHITIAGLHVFWDRRNSSRLGGHCIRRSTLSPRGF